MTTLPYDTGIFTLSLDFELIWGTHDRPHWRQMAALCKVEREVVIDRLLAMFDEFELPATWCTVGHLFLDRCTRVGGVAHRSVTPPTHGWLNRGWFDLDPCSSEAEAPVFYGRDLIRKIQDCPVEQEIGCHTFSHVIFGDPGCSRETAESELAACVDAADALGIDLRSFVFPRNSIGHLPLLRKYGFSCYRGTSPSWYDAQTARPRALRRAGHLYDILTASAPPTVLPSQAAPGLWNIPASMLYTPSFGMRKHVPVALRVHRAMKGLAAATQKRRIFHLWMHPTDVVINMDAMLGGLRRIIAEAARLRDRGQLRLLSMGQIAEECGRSEAKNLIRLDNHRGMRAGNAR